MPIEHRDACEVTRVVAAAGKMARRLWHRLGEVPPVTKADGSLVTVADYVVQALLVDGLSRVRPGMGFICEESRSALEEARRGDLMDLYLESVAAATGRTTAEEALALLDPPAPVDGQQVPPEGGNWWMIDPIDGTAGFVAGAHFSVCVAQVSEGKTRLGVVGCPRLAVRGEASPQRDGPGCVVAGQRGGGAWVMGDMEGAEEEAHLHPLRRSIWKPPVRWARSMNRRGLPLRAQGMVQELGLGVEQTPIDSQCKYVLVAMDRADLVLRLPRAGSPEYAWDHLAGTLVAEEAGATVTDLVGVPLDGGTGARLSRNRGVLCAAPELHAMLLPRLEEQARSGVP